MSSSGSEVCPLCGSPAFQALFEARDPSAPQDTYRIVRCEPCGLVRTIGSGASYPLPYFSIGWFKKLLPGVGASRRRILAGARPGPLLDCGSGEGDFVRAARALGWDARGLDPFAPHAEFRTVEDVERSAFRPKLITLWHSFEHFDDPLPRLKRLAALLAPGGTLFLAVPNFNSTQSQWGRAAWFHLDPPRHRTHLTRATLRAFAAACELSLVDESGTRREYDPAGWLQTMLNLILPEPNAFYRTLKGDPRARAWGLVSLLLIPFLLPLALVLSGLYRAEPATLEARLSRPS